MLALLPPVVDMFLWKVSGEWESWKKEGPIDERRVKALQRIFDSFLSDLNSFAEIDTPIQKKLRSYISSAIEPLPRPVRNEVTKVTSHLIEMLESCPSSSDISKQFHLDSQILGRLITRRYLSSDLSSILAQHTEAYDISLDAGQWHQFVLSAIESGNKDDIAKYHGKKAEALLRPNTGSPTSPAIKGRDEHSAEEAGGTRTTAGGGEGGELSRNKRLRRVADQISEMVISKDGQTLDELLDTLEPYLGASQDHYHPELEHDTPDNNWSSTEEDENGRYSAFMPMPRKYNPHSIVQYAWSTLLHHSSRDKNISTEALLNMADTLPTPALVGHTLTPVMHGLVRRGEPLKAWQLWLDLIEREKEATLRTAKLNPTMASQQELDRPKRTGKGLFIDRVTLGVATEACHAATHNLEAAITLVDTWAYKPKFPPTLSTADEGSVTAASTGLTGTIQLDTQNLNILLNLCRLDNKFSTAHKLWQAALPRYGLFHDDISLNLLLDTARYSDRDSELDSGSGFGSGTSSMGVDDGEMFRRRLRAMADEFGFGRRSNKTTTESTLASDIDPGSEMMGPPDDPIPSSRPPNWNRENAYENKLATGPTSIFLGDHPSDTARRYRTVRDLVPWQRAREIFREVVLGNWPHLENVKSPLEAAHTGPLESIVSFFGGGGSSNGTASPLTATAAKSKSPKSGRETTSDVTTTLNIPSATCKYPHIIPTSDTFRSYIALLGYNNLHSEIPVALAWMKELGIKPNWSTMCLALLHICEAEGPRRWVKGFGGGKSKSKSKSQPSKSEGEGKKGDVSNDDDQGAEAEDIEEDEAEVGHRSGYGLARDEEIVRRWLQEWLGHGWEPENKQIEKGSDDNRKGKDNTKKRRRIVPTEQDVAYSRRWLAQRRKRLTA
ncbi:hypothetical protein IAT40_003754 [Kwoniella sp. CBS 6097]